MLTKVNINRENKCQIIESHIMILCEIIYGALESSVYSGLSAFIASDMT